MSRSAASPDDDPCTPSSCDAETEICATFFEDDGKAGHSCYPIPASCAEDRSCECLATAEEDVGFNLSLCVEHACSAEDGLVVSCPGN